MQEEQVLTWTNSKGKVLWEVVVWEIEREDEGRCYTDKDKQLYDILTHDWIGFYGDIYKPPDFDYIAETIDE